MQLTDAPTATLAGLRPTDLRQRPSEPEYRPFPDESGRNTRQATIEIPVMVSALGLPSGGRILEFGAFGCRGRHCFDEDGPVYRELGKIIDVRRNRLALRRGRQYLREISGDGHTFGLPRMLGGQIRSLVPWSRIFDDHELLVAINTDYHHPSTAWVTIDNDLHAGGGVLRCVYSSDAAQLGSAVEVEARNGKAVRLTVPAAGCAIWE